MISHNSVTRNYFLFHEEVVCTFLCILSEAHPRSSLLFLFFSLPLSSSSPFADPSSSIFSAGEEAPECPEPTSSFSSPFSSTEPSSVSFLSGRRFEVDLLVDLGELTSEPSEVSLSPVVDSWSLLI